MSEDRFARYVDTLFGGEDPLLRQIREEAIALGLPTIQIPLELGRLLRLLISQGTVERVLEIGTLFGYSTIIMARALAEGGRIVTLEADERHAGIAQRNFERAGVAQKVELRLGRAIESLQSLAGHTFDLVFIDADKPGYPAYLDWALELTEPGSLIVADNVWRDGAVLDPRGDEVAEAMARFNANLAAHPRLVSTVVPTRDGADATTLSVVQARDPDR